MTAEQVINMAYSLMNETSSSSFVSTDISLNFLNEALRDVYLRTMLVTNTATINVSTGDYNYDLPTDFMAIPTRDSFKNICTFITLSGTEYTLKYKQLADFYPKSSSTGIPTCFTISFSSTPKMEILLDPTPNASGTINLLYIPTPPSITSTSATIPLPHQLGMPLAYYICFLYSYREKNVGLGDRFLVIYNAMLGKYTGTISSVLRKPKVVWAGLTE